jgi:hypothetical protein
MREALHLAMKTRPFSILNPILALEVRQASDQFRSRNPAEGLKVKKGALQICSAPD